MSENIGHESSVQTDANGLVPWASERPPFDNNVSSHADYCGVRNPDYPNPNCTCPIENPLFTGYGSDLPPTPETQAQMDAEKSYRDFNYEIERDLHALYFRIDAEMGKHDPMSREWQELYLAGRLVNASTDAIRLANERARKYAEVPF